MRFKKTSSQNGCLACRRISAPTRDLFVTSSATLELSLCSVAAPDAADLVGGRSKSEANHHVGEAAFWCLEPWTVRPRATGDAVFHRQFSRSGHERI
jgi:hypothetical protein